MKKFLEKNLTTIVEVAVVIAIATISFELFDFLFKADVKSVCFGLLLALAIVVFNKFYSKLVD